MRVLHAADGGTSHDDRSDGRESDPGRTTDPGPISGESGSYRTAKARVLVVDDDPSTARQVALALEVEGVEGRTASDGDAALAELAAGVEDERPIDVVLVELMLPRRSGLELAREIRDRFPDVRIVLTGAYHLSERQLTRAGCNAIAFVPKPCEPAVVAAFVKEKALRAHRRDVPPGEH
jgi:DNA-binding response OmpR family regulator